MRCLPPLERRTATAAFRRALDLAPAKIAHVEGERSYTFAEAHDRALRIGGGLTGLGGDDTSPVALMLDNHADFAHTWLGLALTGRIQVAVNTSYRDRFLSHLLGDSGARILILEARYVDRVLAVLADLSHLNTLVVRGEMGGCDAPGRTVIQLASLVSGPPAEPVESGPADPMAYMYTSGTTGMSKGVEICHAHAYTYASREDQSRPTSEDRILVTLPMFHLAGQWYGVYQALIAVATCVIAPGFSVSGFWPAVRQHRITQTVMLGAMAELLQQAPPRDDDTDNPLRHAVMAPLASDPEAFAERFGIELEPVYGMSEIGAVLGAYGQPLVPGEAGVPRSEYDLRLVSDTGEDVADGVIGELWVRPKHRELVMTRYHGLPEKTAAAFEGSWLRTGDGFRRDNGHYFFADRMKDSLRRRGENISSFEVERIINEFSAVSESAVVGVPSELTEDEIKAVVVARPDQTIDLVELTQFLIERLPYFMVPRYIEVVPELPRTPTQKVRKHELREAGAGGAWDREAAGIRVRR